MDSSELIVRFQGASDLKPTVLRARELAELITAFEAAVVATVRDHDSSIRAEQVAVSLVSVTEGSIALEFVPALQVFSLPAARKIIEAFISNDFRQLPITALRPLKVIWKFVRKYGCEAEIGIRVQGEIQVSGVITPNTRIETLFRVEGETELYGDVIRVGGVDPRVELKTIQGDTLYCDTTVEVATQIADFLYRQVVVQGVATWDFDTLEIKEFEIQSFSPVKDTPLTETFHELRESIGEFVDEIEDVEEWVTAIREDEEAWNGDSVR